MLIGIRSRFSANTSGGAASAPQPSTVGREIQINGVAFRIVGILPDGFHGDEAGVVTDLWIPSMMLRTGYRWCDAIASPACAPLRLLGRLAPGRSLAAASAELAGVERRDVPGLERGDRLAVLDAVGTDPEAQRLLAPEMRVLLGIAATLLVIACVDLAGLLLARGVWRRREIAVRLAIGASRGRIVRQLTTENALLGLAGTRTARLFAAWLRDVFAAFLSAGSEGGRAAYDLSFDGRVFLFAAVLAVGTTCAFGLLPAFRAAQGETTARLKEGAGAVGLRVAGRFRDGLAAAQVALSLALLVAAGLLVRSADRVLAHSNFDPQHVAILRLRPRLVGETPAQAAAFYRGVTERVSALPGVESMTMGIGGHGLLWSPDAGLDRTLEIAGGPALAVHVLPVSAGFLPRFASRSCRGDRRTRAAWPVRFGSWSTRRRSAASGKARRRWAASSRSTARQRRSSAWWAICARRAGRRLPNIYGTSGRAIRARRATRAWRSGWPATPRALAGIRRAIASVDPRVPIGEDMPLVDQVHSQYAPLWLARGVASACGMAALALSAIGLYSVLAFGVRSRTREIGVRMALGARRADVVRMVAGRALVVVGAGGAAGLVLGVAAARILASQVYGVSARDPLAFGLACAVLLAAAVLAGIFPARAAARVEPVVALRRE